jgi:hypothetical protein
MGVPVRLACTGVRFTPPSLALTPVSDGKKQPPIPQSRPVLPESAPSLYDDDAPPSQRQAVARAVPAPTGDVVVSLPIDRKAFDKYIVRGSTLRLMKRVIRAHVAPRTQRADFEDMLIRAQIEAIEAMDRGAGPRSWETIDGWTAKVTAHAVAHHFRDGKTDAKWLNRDAEVEEQPAEPPEDLLGQDKWMIKPWLEKATENDPADRELLDILCYKARSKKPYNVVARERGMTPAQLSSRIYNFKMKYLPALHRRKETERTVLLLLLFGGLAIAAIIAFVVHFLLPWLDARKPPIPPAVPTSVPVLVPAPEPEPTHFNQAAPTDGGSLKPPKP